MFVMKTHIPLMKRMAFVSRLRAKTLACINPTIGDDGVGISGKARVLVNGEMKLTAVDGPFFDAHTINWESIHEK